MLPEPQCRSRSPVACPLGAGTLAGPVRAVTRPSRRGPAHPLMDFLPSPPGRHQRGSQPNTAL